MESALIVSHQENHITELTNALTGAGAFCERIVTAASANDARRLMADEFAFVLIDAPLRDESGEALARDFAGDSNRQVVLLAPVEHYGAICLRVEDYGVMTIAKPFSRELLWSALKLAAAAHSRMRRLRAENERLVQRIEDIRLTDRAKCLLISYMGLSERDAHKYIEKRAMDSRISKKVVAEGIIKSYEG